ncbi:hypothetical protein P3K87_21465 [Bacillus cytotoxicus]
MECRIVEGLYRLIIQLKKTCITEIFMIGDVEKVSGIKEFQIYKEGYCFL